MISISLSRKVAIVTGAVQGIGRAIAMRCAEAGCRGLAVLDLKIDEYAMGLAQDLEAFGAEVVLTPEKEGTDGAIRRADRFLKEEPDKYYRPNQFENYNNVLSHYETTGPEIFSQTGGEVDVFVAGMGTTGTLMGVGKYLKEKKPQVKIVGIEPTIGHTIQGLKNMKESIVPGIYQAKALDEKLAVNDSQAF